MRKNVISLALALIVLFGSVGITYANAQGISIPAKEEIRIIDQGKKVINNMMCDYMDIDNGNTILSGDIIDISDDGNLILEEYKWDDSEDNKIYSGNFFQYDILNKSLTPFKEYKGYINKTKETDSIDYKLPTYAPFNKEGYHIDGKYKEADFNDFLKSHKGVYYGNSYAIPTYISGRMAGYATILKDGKFIYGAEAPKYYTDDSFGFSFTFYQDTNKKVYYNCNKVISNKEQDIINKALNKYFSKINTKGGSDDEKHLEYEILIEKILSAKESVKSTKTKFILEYMAESARFFRDKKNELLEPSITRGTFVY